MDVRGTNETGRTSTILVNWRMLWILAVALLWSFVPATSHAQAPPLPAEARQSGSAPAPAAPLRARMPLQPVDTLFVAEVAVPGAAQLEQLQQMGYACAELGMCRLEVSGKELSSLKAAGLEATIVEEAVAFSTQPSPAGLLGVEWVYGENLTDYPIPDYSDPTPGNVASPINISTAPLGSVVTWIRLSCRVEHTWPGDLQINVGHQSPVTYATLWNREGGPDDGGFDDDPENDDDVELYDRVEDTFFDGDWVNQTWYLDVFDWAGQDTGFIDWFQLWVYYCALIEDPRLDSPVHDSVLCDSTPLLQWNAAIGADNYQLQVDDDPAFGSPERDVTILALDYQLTTPLPSGEYWWKVRAHDECGWGAWSAPWKFTIDMVPAAPLLASPADGSHTCDATPFCQWSGVGGATLYQIQVDESPSFSSPVVDRWVSVPNLELDFLDPGEYYWRVRASSNSCDGPWSAVWSFVVEPLLPLAPTMVSPADGSLICTDTFTITWESLAAASSYHIQVDDHASFASPEVDETTSSTSYTPSFPLPVGTYFWRVGASNYCGNSPWSAAWSFTIDDAPTAPNLLSPANSSHTCDPSPTFAWNPEYNATLYRIQVDDDPSFSSPELDGTTTGPEYPDPPPLPPGTYHWRVRASNACGDGPWSSVWSFTVDAVPDPPVLFTPLDDSIICDPTPEFGWDVSFGATSYRIQVDDDGSFGSPQINATTTELHYTAPSALSPGIYFWRVLAANHCGEGDWSVPWQFIIDFMPGVPTNPAPADGATGVSINADLDWADASDTTAYDVYFGTSQSPPYYDTTAASDYTLPTLNASTHYYWKIVAKNHCGETSGPVWDFFTGANHVPTLGTVDPSSGSGPVGVTTYFTTTWNDADGWGDLKHCYFHIGSSPSLVNNVTLLYNAAKHKLWIRSDDGMMWLGGFAPGSANVLDNGQAKVYCSLTTAQGSGDTLSVTWAIEFKPGYEGTKKLGLKCKDRQKAKAKGAWKGTWTIE
jgi:hypothetical protein